MKIALDVMGFDSNPEEAILAAINFIKNYSDVEIILVGDEKKINIKKYKLPKNKITVQHVPNVVHTGDDILFAVRDNTSSMYKAIELVKLNKADGVLSAGSTAMFVTLSYTLIGLIDGIKKPAFMSHIPTINGKGFVMLDEGANLTCTANDLYTFAKMANIYCKFVANIINPSISILNIGTEPSKGHDYHRDAHKLLQDDKTLNYVGFIESKHITDGNVDIVVTDGYAGNLTLKALEGILKNMVILLKKEYKKIYNLPAAALSYGVIRKLKNTFNYVDNAGAFVLGLKKNVVKTHGSAKKDEFYSALRMLYTSISVELPEQIKHHLNAK